MLFLRDKLLYGSILAPYLSSDSRSKLKTLSSGFTSTRSQIVCVSCRDARWVADKLRRHIDARCAHRR